MDLLTRNAALWWQRRECGAGADCRDGWEVCWLAEPQGRCGGERSPAAAGLATLLPLALLWDRASVKEPLHVDRTYIRTPPGVYVIRCVMQSALHYIETCAAARSLRQAVFNPRVLLLTVFARLGRLLRIFIHTLAFLLSCCFCLQEMDRIRRVRRALCTARETEFSWIPASRWILCLLLSRPHNKPLVDVWKMFMYFKSKVIRASGNHLSSCLKRKHTHFSLETVP